MRTLLAKTAQGAGQVMVDTEPLGKGGEGSVYSVTSHGVPGLLPAGSVVAKIYHDPTAGERKEKIIAMLQSPPESKSLAWPLAILYDTQKNFLGYLMVKLDYSRNRMWANLAHAGERGEQAKNFDVRYALTASRNLAIAVYSAHAAGHRIGDLNESNGFIADDASVLLVDTDSAQITAPDGRVFRCQVGKPEYTAPELSHGSLSKQDRTVESDMFAFGVAVFQLLTGGAHPTDGIFKGDDDPPSQVERIRNGWYPGLNPQAAGPLSPVPRIVSDAIPSRVLGLIYAALNVTPLARPSFEAAISILGDVLQNLVQCSKVSQHWFDSRDGGCGWCKATSSGRPDPWNMKPAQPKIAIPSQTTLPSVQFGSSGQSVVPQRAAPAIAGQQASHAHAQAHAQATGAPMPPAPAQPQAPQQPTGPPQLTDEQIQKAYKTKKTILTYANGDRRPRPPLGVLFQSNPKLAFSCIRGETPDMGAFWWPVKRDLANPVGLAIALVVGAVFSVLWFYGVPWAGEKWLPQSSIMDKIILASAYLAAGTTLFASILLVVFGMGERFKLKRKTGSLSQYKEESLVKTALRGPGLAIFYGPVILIGLFAAVTFLLLELLSNLLKEKSR